METQSGGGAAGAATDTDTDTKVSSIKRKRTRLETRIETQHKTQLTLISSLQSLAFPEIVSSLDLSLTLLSSFSPLNDKKPFVPTPPLPPAPEITKIALEPTHHPSPVDGPGSAADSGSLASFERTQKVDLRNEGGGGGGGSGGGGGGGGSPLLLVRAMVAESLLQRVPFRPIDSSTVLRKLENDQNATEADRAALRELGGGEEAGPILAVEMALRAIAEENHGGVELEEFVVGGKSTVMVLNIDRSKLIKELPESSLLFDGSSEFSDNNKGGGNSSYGSGFGIGGGMGPKSMPPGDMWMGGPRGMIMGPRGMMPRPPLNSMASPMVSYQQKMRTEEDEMKDLEALLNKKSFLEMQKSKTGEELLDLIHRPTAKETAVAAKFKTKGGSQLKEYCTSLTKEDCRRQTGSFIACDKVHFRRIIAPHTDISQGDCSFLDTCRHMKTCKYVHYELDPTPDVPPMMMGGAALPPPKPLKPQRAEYCSEVELGETQWINCDIRSFKMEILGQFGVIMADPPWDIHMELPYGTMADDEMRNLNVPVLQTDGLIFLWVTGRAMELGRECLELWGYKRVEEIIWVKTNQLQRIIRTGRTGHWLNHSKEHCLVGIKGNPEVNRNIDTDVLVAEVRETSRKPDEMYPLLERISPRTRKLELFARMHNTHAGWMSLGNQLDGVRLVDEGLRARFKAAYPEVAVQPASPPRASVMEVESIQQIADTAPGAAYGSDEKPTANDAVVAA